MRLELSAGSIDLQTGRGTGSAGPITLTGRELALLSYLARHPGMDIPRDTLLTEVWGYGEQVLSRAVDTAMARLRDKIEADPDAPEHLQTVYGVGYRFVPRRVASELPAPAPEQPGRKVVLGDRIVDLDRREVTGPGGVAVLSGTDVALLGALLAAGGRGVHRAALRKVAPQRMSDRALDTAICRLRSRIEPDPGAPVYLLTLRGEGYRLVLRSPPPAQTLTLVQVAPYDDRGRWATEPDPEADLARQLGALAEASRRHGGIVAGDGWRHGFASPRQALAFVQEISPDPALVVAVHRGRPGVWTDPIQGRVTFEGPAVHRLLDLCARCPQGGVVVDAGLAEELRTMGLRAAHLGAGALLLGAEPDAPPTHEIPWARGAFVGRSAELEKLRDWLSAPGLVTLIGPAGVGKSRLALEACTAGRAGQVWYVPLGEARSEDDLVQATARALHIPLSQPMQQLQLALSRRGRLLLWLDDCEGLDGAAGACLARWLRAAPELTVLATSRRVLELQQERILRVEPLPVQDALELFCARSPAGQADRPLIEPWIEELEGLPLAIELAAGRRRSLPAQRIGVLLTERLLLLSGGPSDAAPRHRSLRASLEVSGQLLSEAERRALALCALFRGSFSLQAAERVLSVSDEPGLWLVDVLDRLVMLHLLQVQGDRYAMAESVRAWVQALLPPGLRAQGLRALVAFCEELGGDWRVLRQEEAQLAAAAEAAYTDGEHELAAGVVLAWAPLRLVQGPHTGSWPLLDELIDGPPLVRRAELLLSRGRLRALAGSPSPLDDLREARDLARAQGLELVEAECLLAIGAWMGEVGDWSEQERTLTLALALGRRMGARRLVCKALRLWAIRELIHDVAGAHVRLHEAQAQARLAGSQEELGLVSSGLALASLQRGDLSSARRSWQEALAAHEACGDPRLAAIARRELSNLAIRAGDLAEAHVYVEQSLVTCRAIGDLRGEIGCLCTRSLIHRTLGQLDLALQDAASAVSLVEPLQMPRREAIARVQLGQASYKAGRPPEALAELQRALALAEGFGDSKLAGEILLSLACVEELGLQRRMELLQRASDLFRTVDRVRLAEALFQQVLLAPDQADAVYAEAQALMARIQPSARLLDLAERATQLRQGL
jgi:DNA-binding response OmpR family regulator/predicted ATPase/tetratricopeptide (TPR) repeat protein